MGLVMKKFLLLMLFLFSGVRGEENELFQSQEKKFIRKLQENYTSIGRPVKVEKQSVKVKMELILKQILNIDIKESSMTGIYVVVFEWVDDYLVWSEDDEAQNLEQIVLPANDIWIPDIEVKYLRRQETVIVGSTGYVSWISAMKIKSSCFLDLDKDNHTCELKFGSWNYNGLEIDLQLKSDTIDLSTFVKNREWELVMNQLTIAGTRNEVIYECCPEPYVDITFNIKLRKRQKENEANKTVDIL